MDPKEGKTTSEWKGYKLLLAAAGLVVTLGGALTAGGLVGQDGLAALIVTALVSIATGFIRYNDGRAKVKAAAALEKAATAGTSDP